MEYFYRILIFVHVVSAVASIGPFFILLPIIKKLIHAKEEALHAYLSTFKFVVRLSKHSGHVLVGSGVLLVLLGPWTWETPWIVMTLVIMFLSLFFLARAFSPKLKLFEEDGHDKKELAAKLNRTVWIYISLLLAMLWFMVTKPYFW